MFLKCGPLTQAQLLACTQHTFKGPGPHKVFWPYNFKMAVATPPVRPIRRMPTDQAPRKYYTLHSQPNQAFALKLGEEARTAIVGFAELKDALHIGKMIDMHFIEKKEWPDVQGTGGPLILPRSQFDELINVFIRKWEFDELKFECTRNFLDMVSVNYIFPDKTSYSLSGEIYRFKATDDFYRERIRELFFEGDWPLHSDDS